MRRRTFLRHTLTGLGALALPELLLANNARVRLDERLRPLYDEIDRKFGLEESEDALLVDGEQQRMYLVDGYGGMRIVRAYDISTGITGFGNRAGSGRTPVGIHRIKETFGDGAPIGTVFVARQNTGRIATIHTEPYDDPEDLVTTRIMWLDGCEERNANTHSRCIYIHGTPEEGLIGTPASRGCIRMRNAEAVSLFHLVGPGTYVNIRERV